MNETTPNVNAPEITDSQSNTGEKLFFLFFASTFIFLVVCILGELLVGMLR